MNPAQKRSLTQLQPNREAIPVPLRFYNPELQNAWNIDPYDSERLQRAIQEARELHAAYLQQLAGLSVRLSKRTFSSFSDPNDRLFDAELLEFSVGDALSYLVPRKRRLALSTSVRATLRSSDGRYLHVLTYNNIASVNLNVPQDRWFSWPFGRSRIDCLLANELTAVDADWMSHKFLFVSGATISIDFERVKWERRIAPK